MRCGSCCRVCLSGTLQVGRRGWRILLGGKLGRHPRLGTELAGIYRREGVLAAADCCIGFYLRNARAGERLGDLLQRLGDGELTACIRERAAASRPTNRSAPRPDPPRPGVGEGSALPFDGSAVINRYTGRGGLYVGFH